jgi:hypothetical protein
MIFIPIYPVSMPSRLHGTGPFGKWADTRFVPVLCKLKIRHLLTCSQKDPVLSQVNRAQT